MGLSMGSNPRVPVYSTATAVTLAAITSMLEGDLCYQEDTKVWYYYDGATWSEVAPTPTSYAGGNIMLPIWQPQTVVQGTWAVIIAATDLFAYTLRNSSAANLDEISFSAYLSAGTYNVYLVGFKAIDQGILDVNVDGTTIASFDMYNNGNLINQVLSDTGNVIATSGIKTISIKVDGKNGASSGYNNRVQAVYFTRTA